MPDEPWLSDEQQEVWRSFLQLTGMLSERLDRDLRRDAHMPHTYYLVLAMLSEAPGRSLRMTDLAKAAWSSPSRMSHAVDRLEEAGWVERRRAKGDRRGQIALLTDAGFSRLQSAAPSHADSVRRILFDPLSPELLDAFGQICGLALAQLGGPEECESDGCETADCETADCETADGSDDSARPEGEAARPADDGSARVGAPAAGGQG